ncbi:MAG: pilus assembly protein [Myxococcaceae bacterium]|nr:pilus assembly protein [Myxococcaceae bacterium]
MISPAHDRIPRRVAFRGAATVEFALVTPLLVTMLMFGMFLTDLARVKLKMQEASRYVTWEMTSYLLSDYGAKGRPDHARNFNEALDKTVKEAKERYKDLDSVEDDAGPMASFTYGPFEATLENQDVPFANTSLIQSLPGGDFAADIIGAINGPANAAIGYLGFDTKGRIKSTVNMRVDTRLSALPRHYYDTGSGAMYQSDHWGGYDLSSFNLTSSLTMVVNDWHLADGGDVVARDGRAGRHNSDGVTGLHRQTKRMVLLGLGDLVSRIPLWSTIQNYLPFPQPLGTYTVSHNYVKGTESRNCNYTDGYNGKKGLTNQSPILHEDDQDMRCYDTSPYRDTKAYDQSMYRRIFMARGEWFMGCENPMADDPTITQTYSSDEEQDKTVCSNKLVPPP